jgi:hypothetical protein
VRVEPRSATPPFRDFPVTCRQLCSRCNFSAAAVRLLVLKVMGGFRDAHLSRNSCSKFFMSENRSKCNDDDGVRRLITRSFSTSVDLQIRTEHWGFEKSSSSLAPYPVYRTSSEIKGPPASDNNTLKSKVVRVKSRNAAQPFRDFPVTL